MIATPTLTMPDRDPRTSRQPNGWLTAATAPWLLVGGTLAGLGAGLGIDRWLGVSPWGAAAGSIAGIAAGVWMMVREGSR